MENKKASLSGLLKIIGESFTKNEFIIFIAINDSKYYDDKDIGNELKEEDRSILFLDFVKHCEKKGQLEQLAKKIIEKFPNKKDIESQVFIYPENINITKEENNNQKSKNIKYSNKDNHGNIINVFGDENIILQDIESGGNISINENQDSILKWLKKNTKSNDALVKLLIDYVVRDEYRNENIKEAVSNLLELKKTFIPEFENELHFTNRDIEFTEIDANKDITLYSPSGYGKTYLQKEIKKRYEDNHYKVFYICFKEYADDNKTFKFKTISTVDELDTWLSDKKNFNIKISTNFTSDLLSELKKHKKIIILIDDFEMLSNYDKKIENYFLRILKNIFTNFKRNTEIEYKIILSSRNVKINFIGFLKQIHFREIELTPFNQQNIIDVFNKKIPKNRNFNEKEKRNIASVIHSYTGGHPNAIIKMIDLLIINDFTGIYNDKEDEDYFEYIYRTDFNKIINETVIELLPSAEKDLTILETLKIVSVFRSFNDATLTKLIKDGHIKNYKKYSKARKDILDTNIYKKGTFYSDAIARHLISNYFFINQPDEFKIINEYAISYYKNLIGFDNVKKQNNINKSDYPPLLELKYIIELIYHILVKCKTYNNNADIEVEIKNLVNLSFNSLYNKYNDIAFSGFENEIETIIKNDKDIVAIYDTNSITKIIKNIIKTQK